jgi:hypothetical protein
MLSFLVFYVVSTNVSTMVAARAIRRRHSPDGGIQWLRMKPWTFFIGRCAPLVPPHLLINRNHQQFACIFRCHQLIVAHYHS